MKNMTRLVAPALAAVTMGSTAAPAAAQYYDGYDSPREIRSEIRAYDRKVNRAAANGRISQRQANWLSYRLDGIENQFFRFRRNGFDDWEVRTLYNALANFEYDFKRRVRHGHRDRYRDRRGYRDHHNHRGYRQAYRDRRDYDDDRRGRGWRGDRDD